MKAAIFMSGGGTNAKKIIAEQRKSGRFRTAMIFTDTTASKAKEIAEENSIPYYCNDIKEYYRQKGYTDRKNMEARKEYDRQTAQLLKKHGIELVALCGYMSIVTEEIYEKFLTINIHPADLRMLNEKGKRIYAGCMGAECIRKVIENEGEEARATTHIVTGEVDGGAILLVTKPVGIEVSQDEMQDEKKLKKISEDYHEKLKKEEWKTYPETIRRLAEGRLWIEEEENFVIDMTEEKALLREKILELREKMDEEETEEKSAAITKRLLQSDEYKKAKTIMLYMAKGNEVRTLELLQGALSSGKKVALPITDLSKKEIEAGLAESEEELEEGPFDIPEPKGRTKIRAAEIELIIVPGIAFDENGNRIGYGLGFYDRFLKKTEAKRIALAYEQQIVDRILTTEHDEKIDKIITEERTIDCGVKDE
ncbi:5-formyltetrahydrofolate cyclo-ligase [Candidatus Woesearchaeota archaeon]|nr:5-formyltetrahydrofolate cyclo-ligase [Candidatus Woesearchaeota archaeon]